MFKKIHSLFKIEIQENRIYGLDIIRFIAIISVLFAHGSMIISGDSGSFYQTLFNLVDGVFVFFTLSGFLVGNLLIYNIENKPITKNSLFFFWKKDF